MTWRLITIPYSHYCEKARWCLDFHKLPYKEAGYLPGLHLAATTLRRRGRSVPVLVAGDRVITDSTDILMFADEQRTAGSPSLLGVDSHSKAKVIELEDWLDTSLGVAARVVAYHYLLPSADRLLEVVGSSMKTIERAVLRLMLPALGPQIRRVYRIDAPGVKWALSTIDQVFERTDAALANGKHLAGDFFSAADIALAALSAPLLLWPEMLHRMPESKVKDPLPSMPGAFGDLVESLRLRPTGVYCRKLYQTARR